MQYVHVQYRYEVGGWPQRRGGGVRRSDMCEPSPVRYPRKNTNEVNNEQHTRDAVNFVERRGPSPSIYRFELRLLRVTSSQIYCTVQPQHCSLARPVRTAGHAAGSSHVRPPAQLLLALGSKVSPQHTSLFKCVPVCCLLDRSEYVPAGSDRAASYSYRVRLRVLRQHSGHSGAMPAAITGETHSDQLRFS